MSLLITPTILNSFDWLKKCPPSWKSKAYTDISNTLNRIWVPPKPAVQRGIDFEKFLTQTANIKERTKFGSETFEKCVSKIDGGVFQHKAKFFVEVNGKEYCCYGKIDVHFEDLNIDIKTTGSYRGKNSYLSGWQHKFYAVATKVPNFLYFIIEFDGVKDEILDTYEIEWTMTDPALTKGEIKNHIVQFIEFVEHDEQLKEAYYKRFNLYN